MIPILSHTLIIAFLTGFSVYFQLTLNGSGKIATTEVQSALKVCGVDIPGYRLRECLQKYNTNALSYSQFAELADELAEQKNAEANRWKNRINSVTGAYQVQSGAEHGCDEIVHTIRMEVCSLDCQRYFAWKKPFI